MVDLKDQDMGDGMQCTTHPYTKNPGGICPLCLQEKLGKLVTSSFPLPKPSHLSASSSSKSFSPSSTTTSLALSLSSGSNSNNNNNNNLPFLLAKKKSMLAASSSSSSSSASLIYKRSKSSAAAYGESLNRKKRSGFWSFLHLYSSKHQIAAATTKKVSHSSVPRNQIDNVKKQTTETSNKVVGGGIDVIKEEEDESPRNGVGSNKVVVETPRNGVGSGAGGSSLERKVLRSRSVGCGSRSFSGDFFERISNGFGDCALKRIESQREHTKVISNSGEAADAMSQMVKCGGIFGGFMIMTSSSSSTSASSTVDHHHHKLGNKSAWGRAFASPMRAKTTHKGGTITESSTDKITTPNLDSVSSLVTMKS
ncbi:Vitellogenin-like protein [Hirschfeldia incana]|nr:Vitellogenin-like protein [Hirschfeldia incana]